MLAHLRRKLFVGVWRESVQASRNFDLASRGHDIAVALNANAYSACNSAKFGYRSTARSNDLVAALAVSGCRSYWYELVTSGPPARQAVLE